MQILISADWHIKLGTKNIPDIWATNRYSELFEQLHSKEKEVEKHLILGDVFDRLPKMEELELFFKFIANCSIPTIIIPGNHESVKKNTTFLTYLKNVTNTINNKVNIIDDYYSEDGIDFIPYNRLKEFEKEGYDFTSNILATHCRGSIPPHVKSEVDLSIFDRWKVVLAGDLHSYENSQGLLLYPGSPITTSFHRSRVDTGVIIIDTDTLVHRWVKLDLPQLIRKTIKAGEPMPPGERDHVIYEVEGDMAELAGVAGHDLIDKKVVRRQHDTALILDASMTIAEEVEEYLRYVLGLNDDSVQSVLKELQQYV